MHLDVIFVFPHDKIYSSNFPTVSLKRPQYGLDIVCGWFVYMFTGAYHSQRKSSRVYHHPSPCHQSRCLPQSTSGCCRHPPDVSGRWTSCTQMKHWMDRGVVICMCMNVVHILHGKLINVENIISLNDHGFLICGPI